MITGIKPHYPLMTASKKKMAHCRLCGRPMYGIYDLNLRFYGECCDSIQEHTDVHPRKKPLKVWSPI